jgi:hypothetical protein
MLTTIILCPVLFSVAGLFPVPGSPPTKQRVDLSSLRNAVIVQDWKQVRADLAQAEDAKKTFGELIRSFHGGQPGSSGTAPLYFDSRQLLLSQPVLRLTAPLDVVELARLAPSELTSEEAHALGQVFRHALGRFSDAAEQNRWKQLLLNRLKELQAEKAQTRYRLLGLLIGADLLEEAVRLMPELQTNKAAVPEGLLEQFGQQLLHQVALADSDPRPGNPTRVDPEKWEAAWQFYQELLADSRFQGERKMSALRSSLQLLQKAADEEMGTDRFQTLVDQRPQDRERILQLWLEIVNPVSPQQIRTDTVKLLRMLPERLVRGPHSPESELRLPLVLTELYLERSQPEQAVKYLNELSSKGYPDAASQLAGITLQSWASRHQTGEPGQRPTILTQFKTFISQFPPGILREESIARSFQQLISLAKPFPVEAKSQSSGLPDPLTVFTVEDIEVAFGDIASMNPKLLQCVAANLIERWTEAGGEEQRTPRSSLQRKYNVLTAFFAIDKLLEQLCSRKANWRLFQTHAQLLATCFDTFGNQPDAVEAALRLHDPKDNRHGAAMLSDIHHRLFARFRQAADSYRDECRTAATPESHVPLYTRWFNAAVRDQTQSIPTLSKRIPSSQFQEIRAALNDLPPAVRRPCLEQFATEVVTQINYLSEEKRYTYVKWASTVASAPDLKRRYDYYERLRGQVKFRVWLDGDFRVGGDRPFGLFLSVLQTAESLQELGAFQTPIGTAKLFQMNYLDQGEVSGNFFAVDLKFHEWPLQAHPGEGADQGWLVYPLGYVVLKAKDSAPRDIPPLQFDVSLPDLLPIGTGTRPPPRVRNQVILPLTSEPVAIDAGTAVLRPVSNPHLTQTLVQAFDGRLSLVVAATGNGVLSEDVRAWLDLDDIDWLQGQPSLSRNSYTQLDAGSGRPSAECTWTLPLDRARALHGGRFDFPTAKVGGAAPGEWHWSHDLKPSDPLKEPWVVVDELPSRFWPWGGLAGAAVVLGLGAWCGWRWLHKRPPIDIKSRPAEAVDTFKLIGWLRQLEAPPWEAIARLEKYFFEENSPPATDPELQRFYSRYAEAFRSGQERGGSFPVGRSHGAPHHSVSEAW